MSQIIYSILIPHKNTPDLLQYCLDSIPVRDDVQVIVVDDNSDADKVDFGHFPQWAGEHFEYYLTEEGRGAFDRALFGGQRCLYIEFQPYAKDGIQERMVDS